jgi:hypothetical protein
MAVSKVGMLKQYHETAAAIAKKVISSDYTLVISGYESNYLLCPTFPVPTLKIGEAIEIPSVAGTKVYQQGQVVTNYQGAISFEETEASSIRSMYGLIMANGGTFNAKVYHGTPDNFVSCYKIYNCSMSLDMPDSDWESNTQILKVAGTIFFHFYGEEEKGTVTSLITKA